MQPTPTWAASPSLLRATGRCGGAAACARLGSRTGGRRKSATGHKAKAAPMRLAGQFAPAMTWLTITLRWQRSGTGRPMGEGDQRLWQQAAVSRQPGGVPSVGTDGPPLRLAEHVVGMDAPSVPMRPVASRQRSPASAVERQACWLSGTGKPMRDVAGIQTRSLWVQPRRCTGSCKTSASWAWCTDGRHHRHIVLD